MLLEIARDEIKGQLLGERKDRQRDGELPGIFQTKCGVFVSLYVDNKLRGCIGTFSEDKSLLSNIKRMALSAAMHDSRFTSVRAEETQGMRIEISVLSPRKKIRGPEEIEIGKHGIFVESGLNKGTLLPQVALSQGWNADEFLGNCSKYKAGLGWDGWKTASLFTYEATVFDSDSLD